MAGQALQEKPASDMGFHDAFIVESPTGARLSTRHQAARGPERAIFLISHGLAEHSLRYAPLADALAARGYQVYGFDHRGHGLTTAPDAERGRFAKRDGEAMLLADLAAIREFALHRHPSLPVLLLGHSMGGVVAARAAETRPSAHAGLCIWNAKLDPGLAGRAGLLLLKAERMFKGSDVPSYFGQRLVLDRYAASIQGAATEFDWLSRDAGEVEAYRADPLCGFACSVSLWIDLIRMSIDAGEHRNLARLPKDLPVNLVGGGADPVTENGRAMTWLAERLKRHGITNVHLTIYPDMRHETLKEHGRDAAIEALADWADGVVARRRV